MLIDTHSHLNFKDFDKDRDEVVRKSLDSNVWLIDVGDDYQSSKKSVEMAEKYEKGVYAAIGLHPENISNEDFDSEKYKELAKFHSTGSGQASKVVAIGEIGLDYLNVKEESKNKQKEILLKQIDLARELDLPIIFHCRKAHDELINELRIMNKELWMKGVVHCFTGKWRQAEKYLAMGFYLGFNGIIYKMDLTSTIKRVPKDRILLETDCPFLVPPPAGIKRNEPVFVGQIAEIVAKIRGEKTEEIIEKNWENAKRLFRLGEQIR